MKILYNILTYVGINISHIYASRIIAYILHFELATILFRISL